VINPWIIAFTVMLATFMEVLDTSIANVALRHIAGSLSASVEEATWVLTSYLVANAIILPMGAWFSMLLGRKRFYMICVGLFTVSSVLCGMAPSLGWLIFFRVMQGLGGGALQPISQAILVESFPRAKQGMAMAVYGMGVVVAPVIGPTLGGWITDNYSWRWIFYINVPVGLVALFMCSRLVVDPDYLVAQRAAARRQAQPFDLLGLVLLAVTMVCWEVMLSKGQEWDWLGDPFLRVQTLLVLFLVCLVALIVRQLRIANPLINFRTLSERNFRSCCIIIFCAYGVLYANTTTLPALLQSLFGYDATRSGLVLSPSGVASLMMLFVVGILLGRGLDARYLMAAGVLTLAAGNLWLSRLNLDIGPWQVVWPRVVVISGLSMLFAPLNLAAFLYIPPRLRGAAIGLLALLRNEGGSVGTSMAQTILERREQFHVLRLNEKLDAVNPAVQGWLQQGRELFMQRTGDPVRSQQMALRSLQELRDRQAASLAYFDVFWASAVVAALMVFLVLLMRRSVAEKGAHVGAE
jgi:MFS transporter, DHA2 family, multidrug resistance protein